MSEEKPILLPLGTAVKIKNDESIYILISRGFQKNGAEMIAGYAGVPHPFGQNSKYKTVIISTQDILEIVQKGFENELDADFIQEQLENATAAPKKKVDTQEEGSLGAKAKEKKTEANEQPFDPYDPFYSLIKRAKVPNKT
ncbi:MAG: DUF4176 domain-containing protein [Streptococcaceae bacterium]|jgi:hypothetical protein|nr:DUF4176 domain-containing protein [Streptococcaceae bacterium]